MSATDSQTTDDYAFYNQMVVPIPGWLHQGAAIRTMDILAFQERNAISGSLLEIGVYCGKYLSLLLRSAGAVPSVVLGVDTFQMAAREKVLEHLQPVITACKVMPSLLQSFSTNCRVEQLLGRLLQRPRFISVDGSHERDDVYYDLELAEQLLAPGGVIAVDDFLNPMTFGVNEATHIFFARPRRLVPWVYCQNKLFLSDRQWVARYRAMIEERVRGDEIEPHSARFRQLEKDSRLLVEQKLWGSPVLLLP